MPRPLSAIAPGASAKLRDLLSDVESPLNQAQALTGALLLTGFGFKSTGNSQGEAVIALAEAVAEELTKDKSRWRKSWAVVHRSAAVKTSQNR